MNDYESTFREYWGYVKDFFRSEFGKEIDEDLPPIIVVKRKKGKIDRKIIWYSKGAQYLVDLINGPAPQDELEAQKQEAAKFVLNWGLYTGEEGRCNFFLDSFIIYFLDENQEMPKENVIVHEMVHRAGVYFNPKGSDLLYLGGEDYTTEFTTWLILNKYKGRNLKEIPLEKKYSEIYLTPRKDLGRIGNYEDGLNRLKEILRKKPIVHPFNPYFEH